MWISRVFPQHFLFPTKGEVNKAIDLSEFLSYQEQFC